MDDVDRESIRDSKGVCGGCGAPLRSVGDIPEEGRRGEGFECTRGTCGDAEWRLYGDRYYELQGE